MDYMEVTKLHFDRENDDYPVDLGAPYFQTKPKLIPRISKMHRFSSSKPRRRSFTGVHLCEWRAIRSQVRARDMQGGDFTIKNVDLSRLNHQEGCYHLLMTNIAIENPL